MENFVRRGRNPAETRIGHLKPGPGTEAAEDYSPAALVSYGSGAGIDAALEPLRELRAIEFLGLIWLKEQRRGGAGHRGVGAFGIIGGFECAAGPGQSQARQGCGVEVVTTNHFAATYDGRVTSEDLAQFAGGEFATVKADVVDLAVEAASSVETSKILFFIFRNAEVALWFWTTLISFSGFCCSRSVSMSGTPERRRRA